MEKYEENEALKALSSQLQAMEDEKGDAYSSLWEQQLRETLDKILNRDSFRYDPAGDALYSQYRNLYENQGERAMEDTFGQASALTGGYGNSYAATASQQAYQQSLQQLGEKLPQLYQLALQRYSAEGDSLRSRYDLLSRQEEADYTRYRDNLADWQNRKKELQERYETQREQDYRQYRDEVADSQWQREFDEAVRQFNIKRGIRL